ncbi:ACL002Cp [Eremothecium gossypii ATCC 10895]|uniref:ACL002Cp n=1 Tax=Eremothecium gossypii (strain ATCC 10895 / CBS 109.51 / FGSC 9923 / NRRL Y-1056) TaxID=284811 RepID=Q75CB3_EREGS|nr:ACL002Cp [Eremothecium gossypii ATCC 10895]AAS51226.2 ACL002Cp [Eremothecium gossypii ATCC 10895]AEY95517.1 FACL002Cp [Eremothecium gossypii FDAG1]
MNDSDLKQRVKFVAPENDTASSYSTKETTFLQDGTVAAAITATRAIREVSSLCSWDDLPDWQKDNEHILSGYVRETNSYRKTFRSLFYLHNESVNIYSHLIPGICFLFIALFNKYVVADYSTTTWKDYLMIDIFLLGAVVCLTLSGVYHCMKSHSLEVSVFGNKLDYIGIVALISCSMISQMYYGFYDSTAMFSLFSTVTLSLALACAVVSLSPHFRSREWRKYRAAIFTAFGLSGLLPVITSCFYYGPIEAYSRIQLKWLSLEGVLYISGAVLYGVRFPERLAPGSFDIWGHSHQLFHVLVVIAALCHLRALLSCYKNVHTNALFVSL